MKNSSSVRSRRAGAAIQLLCLLLGLLVAFPVLYGICGAFKEPSEFSRPSLLPASFLNMANFRAVFERVPMAHYLLNSLVTAAGGTLIRLLVASLAAYAFAFFRFRGQHFLFFLILGAMMIPADTLLIQNYQTVSRLHLLDTYLGISIVSFAGAGPMFMLRQYYASAPAALRDAALLDGCGDLGFLRHVLLPVSMPVLSTLALQSFVALWNVYLWPLAVTNTDAMRTVQVGISRLTTIDGSNYHIILCASTVALLPILLLFLCLRTRIQHAMTAGAVTG